MKLLFTALMMIFFVGAGFSQSSKMDQRAIDKTTELNAMIVAGDETVALTEEQMETIQALYVKMFEGVKMIRKGDATEEEKQEQMKATRKAINREINKNVLTKEQRQAKKAGKEEE